MSQAPLKPQKQKSLTANFQLQTKIRLIIQDVLTGTIRKLSNITQKVDKFQQFLMGFRQRNDIADKQRRVQQEQMSRILNMQEAIRKQLAQNISNYNEQRANLAIDTKTQNQLHKQHSQQLKFLMKQHQIVSGQINRSKNKFIQFSGLISQTKQEMTFKITKYLQETALKQRQIKLSAQNISSQYFNLGLQLQKQQKRYDQILIKYQQDEEYKQETKSTINRLVKMESGLTQFQKKIYGKIDHVQYGFLSRMKQLQLKFDTKTQEFQKTTTKLQGIIKRIDQCTQVVNETREDVRDGRVIMLRTIQQKFNKLRTYIDQQIIKISKESTRIQKSFEKKLQVLQQTDRQNQNYFMSKLQVLRSQLLSQIANNTFKIMQQKDSRQKSMSSAVVQQIHQRIGKENIQIIQKIQHISCNFQTHKKEVQVQIQNIAKNNNNMAKGNTLSDQDLQTIHELKKGLQKTNGLDKKIDSIIIYLKDLMKQSSMKLTDQIERVMFLVTKMRGDAILRAQLNQKIINQLKTGWRKTLENQQYIWKILPGQAQCINMILSLIFDAQFQSCKIIQDNLPSLNKELQRFNTISEGVIYEFKQRKKLGFIYYRRQQIKKIELVRATFLSHLKIWQEMYQIQQKKGENFPKHFFRKMIQAHLKGLTPQYQLKSQQNNGSMASREGSRQPSREARTAPRVMTEGTKEMSATFNVRRKKNFYRQKEEISSLGCEEPIVQ